MIHLIWSTLNLAVVFYFLYLIVGFIAKGIRIFKSRIKVVSICILLIGFVSILFASNSEKNTNRISIATNCIMKNNSKIEEIILEDNLTFNINMLVKYSIEQNKTIPIESNSFLTGFISGYVWKFKSIQTNSYTANEKAKFVAKGILEWNLFGLTIYSQSKTYSGIIN